MLRIVLHKYLRSRCLWKKSSASGTSVSSSPTSVSELTSSPSVSKSGEGKGSEDNLNEYSSTSHYTEIVHLWHQTYRYAVGANKPAT